MANLNVGRKSGFILRSGVRRRQMLWLQGLEQRVTLAAINTGNLVATLNAAAQALLPFTVVRTRGFWSVESDQIAATEVFGAALGHIVVTQQATAIGVSAVPTPSSDDGADWFMLDRLWQSFRRADGTGEMLFQVQKDVDSKAMRKLDQGDDLAVVIESGPVDAGQIVQLYARHLIKLH